MIAQLNSAFRHRFPNCHQRMLGTLRHVMFKLPRHPERLPALPRKMESELIWVHPRFVATTLDVEPHVRRWLRDYLKPGNVLFDVGAYVGWHSLYGARLVGKGGKVYSFEPSPANSFCVEYHKKKNDLSQMEIVRAAVADSAEGTVTFHLLNGGDSTSNSMNFSDNFAAAQANQSFTEITVPTTTIAAFAKSSGHTPDVIKIDIEGAELLALYGARPLMETRRMPIILAVHPAWLPAGQTPDQIVEFLHEAGYEIFDEQGKPATELSLEDYLCLPKGSVPLS